MSERGPATTTRWTPPLVVPPNWRPYEQHADGGWWRVEDVKGELAVLATCSTERDGREWVHVSISRRDRCPTWSDLTRAKDVVLGNCEAYCVLPPKERYVNTHPNCLHLFACLDGPQLPDFRVDVKANQL